MISDLIPITLIRLPRNKCGACGKRRILFALTVYGEVRGVALCAICARIR
jgi:hypothetical protein